MIYQIFNMIGQAFALAWGFLVDIVEASGMSKIVFIGLIVSLNVLVIVFGTLRARAFMGGDNAENISSKEMFERDVNRSMYRSEVTKEANARMRSGHIANRSKIRGGKK